MRKPDKAMKDWMKVSIEVHKCLEMLEKLRNEKKRLLKSVEDGTATQKNLKRLKELEGEYEILLNTTAELNARAKALKENVE